jgi:hypothetical protein
MEDLFSTSVRSPVPPLCRSRPANSGESGVGLGRLALAPHVLLRGMEWSPPSRIDVCFFVYPAPWHCRLGNLIAFL